MKTTPTPHKYAPHIIPVPVPRTWKDRLVDALALVSLVAVVAAVAVIWLSVASSLDISARESNDELASAYALGRHVGQTEGRAAALADVQAGKIGQADLSTACTAWWFDPAAAQATLTSGSATPATRSRLCGKWGRP
jgi:hypothetical protein